MGNLISFFEALDKLGPTNRERAKAMGISLRTFYDLKAGRLPSFAHTLLKHPELAEALADDARAGRTNGHEQPADPVAK